MGGENLLPKYVDGLQVGFNPSLRKRYLNTFSIFYDHLNCQMMR